MKKVLFTIMSVSILFLNSCSEQEATPIVNASILDAEAAFSFYAASGGLGVTTTCGPIIAGLQFGIAGILGAQASGLLGNRRNLMYSSQ